MNKKVKISVFIMFCVGLFTALIISGLILSATSKTAESGGTVIVLGCKVNGGGLPGLMLERRILVALEYLEENPNSKCVATGGQGEGEVISEALCIKNYLVAHGIDENRIYMEERSINTYENINYAKEIINTHGLSKNVAIASSGFHLFRGARFAEKAGLTASVLPARTPLSILPFYWVREICSIIRWLPHLI